MITQGSSWAYYKAWSRRVSAALATSDDAALRKRARAIYACADDVAAVQRQDGGVTIIGTAARCRDRACPLCEWRLALARTGQLTAVLQHLLRQQPRTRGWLCTLTVRNCAAAELRDTCRALLAAWRRLLRCGVCADWQGTMRALEVTYNRQADTYHPHIHALVVSDSLDGVACRVALSAAWAAAAGTTYDPIVYLAPAGGQAAYEVSKPAAHLATAGAYIAGLKGAARDASLTRRVDPRAACTMAAALRGLRLIAYGGSLAAARRALRQGDTPQDEDAAADALTAAQAACIAARPDTRAVICCAWDSATGTYIPTTHAPPIAGARRRETHGSDTRAGSASNRGDWTHGSGHRWRPA